MWQMYVYTFLAGMLSANGVPHFVKGVSGERHPSPFGRSSSSVVNVFWGWLNFIAAGALVYWSGYHAHLLRSLSLIALGALFMGLVLASRWSNEREHNKK